MTATSKERPILFKSAMVWAIQAGQKTQTRRIVKLPPLQPWQVYSKGWHFIESNHSIDDCNNYIAGFGDGRGTIINIKCPYGKPAFAPFNLPADRLWVRETWGLTVEDTVCYRADEPRSIVTRWRPSMFMPRWASRITLEITAVRVERLQDIGEADARAEGVTAVCAYRKLWEKIHGPGSWDANPYVWVVEFRQVTPSTTATKP
jgi:hypothetical protein